jgi:hypothetical protein
MQNKPMTPDDKNSMIAAGLILFGFGGLFWFMPKIVLGLGAWSPWLGGAAAVLFVAAFFGVFWLRSKSRRK